jgi:hypothetical protein
MLAGHDLQFTVNLMPVLSWWIPLNWALLKVFWCKTSIFARSDDLK